MKTKYVILDEIKLELVKNFCGEVVLFTNKNKAIKEALNYYDAWQVIEIPFGE